MVGAEPLPGGGWRLDAIGDLMAPDREQGALLELRLVDGAPRLSVLVDQRRRLVAHALGDLDGDGAGDVATAEFGDAARGRIEVRWGGGDAVALDLRPGAVAMAAADATGDGRTDLLALFAQGRQELVLFANLGGRRFERRQLQEWSSSFGANGMRRADLDGDGSHELVLFCGNNLELREPPLRPYHGVRVWSLDGGTRERSFHPMHGVMAGEVADLDGDGDQDIAAAAWSPDWSAEAPATFAWLERTADGAFVPHELEVAHAQRWMSLGVGDWDGDGAIDIVLGGGRIASNVPSAQLERFRALTASASPLLVLRNRGADGAVRF